MLHGSRSRVSDTRVACHRCFSLCSVSRAQSTTRCERADVADGTSNLRGHIATCGHRSDSPWTWPDVQHNLVTMANVGRWRTASTKHFLAGSRADYSDPPDWAGRDHYRRWRRMVSMERTTDVRIHKRAHNVLRLKEGFSWQESSVGTGSARCSAGSAKQSGNAEESEQDSSLLSHRQWSFCTYL